MQGTSRTLASPTHRQGIPHFGSSPTEGRAIANYYRVQLSSHLAGTVAAYSLRTTAKAWSCDGRRGGPREIDRTVTGEVNASPLWVPLLDGDEGPRVEIETVTVTFTNGGMQNGKHVNLLIRALAMPVVPNMLGVVDDEHYISFYRGKRVRRVGDAIVMSRPGAVGFDFKSLERHRRQQLDGAARLAARLVGRLATHELAALEGQLAGVESRAHLLGRLERIIDDLEALMNGTDFEARLADALGRLWVLAEEIRDVDAINSVLVSGLVDAIEDSVVVIMALL